MGFFFRFFSFLSFLSFEFFPKLNFYKILKSQKMDSEESSTVPPSEQADKQAAPSEEKKEGLQPIESGLLETDIEDKRKLIIILEKA